MTLVGYNRIFEGEFPESRFIPGGNAMDVLRDAQGIAYALGVLTQGTQVIRLVDRDARSEEEVAELKEQGIRVLSKRNLESYIFDDEILRALSASVGKEEKAEELVAAKQGIRAARSGDAPDDLKPPSGEIYVSCMKILELATLATTPRRSCETRSHRSSHRTYRCMAN